LLPGAKTDIRGRVSFPVPGTQDDMRADGSFGALHLF